jgi:hypothetical protein
LKAASLELAEALITASLVEQNRARCEMFPQVVNDGRWRGQISFRHVKSGEIIPFLLDWFRIDDLRTGRPTNMAALGRDLRGQKRLEAELRRLNGSLEQRVIKRTTELAQALQQLTIEDDPSRRQSP